MEEPERLPNRPMELNKTFLFRVGIPKLETYPLCLPFLSPFKYCTTF